MQRASSEREPGDAGPNAPAAKRASKTREQAGWDAQPVSLYSFLDRVISDERKTRRLGYLMRQAGFVAVVVLVSLAAVCYIGMYKAPLVMKAGVGGGSVLFIILGSIAGRIGRASRQRRIGKGARPAVLSPSPPPSREKSDRPRIGEDDHPNDQHGSYGNPHGGLGAASQPRCGEGS